MFLENTRCTQYVNKQLTGHRRISIGDTSEMQELVLFMNKPSLRCQSIYLGEERYDIPLVTSKLTIGRHIHLTDPVLESLRDHSINFYKHDVSPNTTLQ